MKPRMATIRKVAVFATLFMIAAFAAGCGTANRAVKLDEGYSLRPGTKFATGTITNGTGNTYEEIDVTKALMEAMDKSLEKSGLRFEGATDDAYILLPCKIVEYEQGNAFKRWLMPGWGSTALSVQCELKESPGERTVGSVEARRTVDAGGGYTIGAWKTIFTTVADDVTIEIGSKIGN